MKFVLHGVLASLAITLATPAKAKPSAEFDRHSVAEYRYHSPVVYWGYKKRVKRHVERKKQRRTLSLARPVVVPQPFVPVVAQTEYDGAKFTARGPDLVAAALRFLGTNPGGWKHPTLWCAEFMGRIAPHAARRIRNPNFARNWAHLPRVEPRRGAIAVLTRGRHGGHIGVILQVKKNGDLVVVSGNYGRKVGTGTYSRRRLIAAVQA